MKVTRCAVLLVALPGLPTSTYAESPAVDLVKAFLTAANQGQPQATLAEKYFSGPVRTALSQATAQERSQSFTELVEPGPIERIEILKERQTQTGAHVVARVYFKKGRVAQYEIAMVKERSGPRIASLEKQALGEDKVVLNLRRLVTAEHAYRESNGGFFDRLECLVTPTSCIPGYSPTQPTFVDPTSVQSQRYGYRWTFYGGERVPPAATAHQHLSPSSVKSFYITAVPVTPGSGANRGFCGDANGVVCYTSDGSEPSAPHGRCGPAPKPGVYVEMGPCGR